MAATTPGKAFEAANREGLYFFWARTHVGGSVQFVGNSWEDGGFTEDEEGTPINDSRGNTVAAHTAEDLDPANAQHVAQCEEWYGY